VPVLFTEAARLQSWLDMEAALAGAARAGHHPRRNAGFEHSRNTNWPMFRRSLITASGGKGSFAPVTVNGGNAPIPAVRLAASKRQERP
jgi:hypothetical protein